MDVTEVVVMAKSTLNHWINAQDKFFDSSLGYMTQDDGVERWRTPNVDTIKINTDAAIFETSCCYSFALVAHDHTGALVEASSRCLLSNASPEMAEIMGIREALSWVKRRPGIKVEIETDSLIAVQAIRSSAVKLSYLGRLVQECRELLVETKDRIVSLKFVRRSANNVAHYLARYSCFPADRVWRGDNAHSALVDVM
nr:PREDICTED: uncharacterized protein LOC108222412 isoform X3 [Daucus carota subsp. sativus]XP_017251821.1 PREDICTED: uncharacterized protein LOC108222412 isoform X3 [Daucus carota subsp. sativus]